MKIVFIRKKHKKLALNFSSLYRKMPYYLFYVKWKRRRRVFEVISYIIKKHLVDIANGIFYTLPTPKVTHRTMGFVRSNP